MRESDCCGAELLYDNGDPICSSCKEHCEVFETEETEDYDLNEFIVKMHKKMINNGVFSKDEVSNLLSIISILKTELEVEKVRYRVPALHK